MKKLLLLCLLGGVCLLSNTLKAKDRVADSPGTNFLHRFMSLRGGETRSTSPPGFSLVDDSNSHGQGSLDSLAGGEVLVYVELAKKGEVDTLTFETIPFQVSRLHPNYRQEETHLVGRRGNMFEGVNPEVDQIFEFSTDAYSDAGYLTLKHGEVKILNRFLVFPGDSIKIRINPETYSIVFAGPAADLFECQYQMSLAKGKERFEKPSVMYTSDPEQLLTRKDYREMYRSASSKFGSHMDLISRGKEQDEFLFFQLNRPKEELSEWKVLQGFKDRISNEAFDLLEADVLGGYLSSIIKTIQTESYQDAMGDSERRKRIVQQLRSFLIQSDQTEYTPYIASHSDGWTQYQYTRAYWKAILEKSSFSSGVIEDYTEDLRAKILLKYLMDNFSRIRDKAGFLDKIEPYLREGDQQLQMLEYRNKYLAGAPVLDFSFQDKEGRTYTKSDFQGKLTLFYFWVTGCMGSEQFYSNRLDSLKALFPPTDRMAWVAVNASQSPEIWRLGLESGNYTDGDFINLYLGSEDEDWRKYYNIHLFPQLLFMDDEGKVLELNYLNQPLNILAEQIETALTSSTTSPSQLP